MRASLPPTADKSHCNIIHNKLGNVKKVQKEMLTLWVDPMILNTEY